MMRLLIIVPTEMHKVTAGSRIRYDRLAENGDYFDLKVHSLEVLSQVALRQCDVCIFSKTYSIGAIAVARSLQRSGKVVGIDLFDDYFSQRDDTRLTRFRTWLRCFAETFQFALCSTSTMHRVIADYVPSLPVQIVPDPYPTVDARMLASTLAAKRDRARSERVIDALWFGIGANPFFSVGLRDLSGFAWSLAELASGPFDVRLTVLTDKASQTAGNLARLSKLPVSYRVETWTLETERQALDTTLVSFIPVNGQSFSRAKSLNRALTAISAGTQILSPGFPLYQDLGEAIYRDGFELASDLETGTMRIRPENALEIEALSSKVSEVGSVVADLFLFLTRQVRGVARRRVAALADAQVSASKSARHALQAVIFGQDLDRLTLLAAQAGEVLSVKTPYCRAERVYDIRFENREDRKLDIWIKVQHVPHLREELRESCSPPKKIGKSRMVKVDAGEDGFLDRVPSLLSTDGNAVLLETEAYRNVMRDYERVCRRLFPTIDFIQTDLRLHLEPLADATLAA